LCDFLFPAERQIFLSSEFPPVGAILSGPHWPDRVRVVRVEPRGTSRVLIEAVILDGQARPGLGLTTKGIGDLSGAFSELRKEEDEYERLDAKKELRIP
jgi:hypothetical protein